MAEEDAQEKTEEPSDRKLEKAREEGQVAKTPELSSLITLATAMALLSAWGPGMGRDLMFALKSVFQYMHAGGIYSFPSWFETYALPPIETCFWFGGILMALSVIGSLMQTKGNVSIKAFVPKFEHINPVAGLKRYMSPQTIVQLVKSLLKVSFVGMIIYNDFKNHIPDIMAMGSIPFTEAMSWCGARMASIVLKVSLFLAVIALFDYLYQWYTTHKQLMMSHQELKDEMKDAQLPPHVRNKVRQVANERAKRTIQKEVPNADVVVTNPTHFAVALKYRRFLDPAPRVVAKGHDLLAATIREVAKKNNVPLYEYPEVARKLYKEVKVGQVISSDMYEVVARILAFVYKLHKERKMVRI